MLSLWLTKQCTFKSVKQIFLQDYVFKVFSCILVWDNSAKKEGFFNFWGLNDDIDKKWSDWNFWRFTLEINKSGPSVNIQQKPCWLWKGLQEICKNRTINSITIFHQQSEGIYVMNKPGIQMVESSDLIKRCIIHARLLISENNSWIWDFLDLFLVKCGPNNRCGLSIGLVKVHCTDESIVCLYCI
jgi:hypothetical protein